MSRQRRPYVYTLAYPDGAIFYIGKGRGYRINRHEQEARNYRKGTNLHKCRVIRKIQADGGQVAKTILAYFNTDEEAFLYEIALIFFMDGLTNLTNGGEGTFGYVQSEEHRRKLSEAGKRQVQSEETRRKRAELERGNQRGKGHIVSETHRKKISEAVIEANRRRVQSEATRKKISDAGKMLWQTRKERMTNHG